MADSYRLKENIKILFTFQNAPDNDVPYAVLSGSGKYGPWYLYNGAVECNVDGYEFNEQTSLFASQFLHELLVERGAGDQAQFQITKKEVDGKTEYEVEMVSGPIQAGLQIKKKMMTDDGEKWQNERWDEGVAAVAAGTPEATPVVTAGTQAHFQTVNVEKGLSISEAMEVMEQCWGGAMALIPDDTYKPDELAEQVRPLATTLFIAVTGGRSSLPKGWKSQLEEKVELVKEVLDGEEVPEDEIPLPF